MARATVVLAAVLAAGCAERNLRQTVEARRQRGDIAARDSDEARAQLARAQADRAADQTRLVQLQERLKTQGEVETLLKRRLADAQREGERLQSELAAAAATAANSGAAISPASGRVEPEPFHLPAPFVGRLKALAGKWPCVQFDARAKALRLPDAKLFKPDGEPLPESWDLLREFADALKPDATDLKLLVQVNVPPGPLPRTVNVRLYPTPWHLATHKAVNIEQRLEDRGVPAANLGISVQQFERDRDGGIAVFFNPSDVELSK